MLAGLKKCWAVCRSEINAIRRKHLYISLIQNPPFWPRLFLIKKDIHKTIVFIKSVVNCAENSTLTASDAILIFCLSEISVSALFSFLCTFWRWNFLGSNIWLSVHFFQIPFPTIFLSEWQMNCNDGPRCCDGLILRRQEPYSMVKFACVFPPNSDHSQLTSND